MKLQIQSEPFNSVQLKLRHFLFNLAKENWKFLGKLLLRWFLLFIYLRHIWEFPKFTNSKFGNIYPQFKVFLSICTVMAALQRSRGKSCTKSWNLTRESKMSSFSKNKSSFQPKSGREKKSLVISFSGSSVPFQV